MCRCGCRAYTTGLTCIFCRHDSHDFPIVMKKRP
jgi:hypothetical protein